MGHVSRDMYITAEIINMICLHPYVCICNTLRPISICHWNNTPDINLSLTLLKLKHVMLSVILLRPFSDHTGSMIILRSVCMMGRGILFTRRPDETSLKRNTDNYILMGVL